MALNVACTLEVRTTGSDNNGGGFKTGATGTNRSLQDAAQASLTTLSVVNATTTKVTISLTDYTVVAADVGNMLQVTGGTATAGFYEITAVDTVANTWTVDRSLGTAGQTVVGAMGGALATIGKATAAATTGDMLIWVKATATYAITATVTMPTAAGSQYNFRVFGYTTTRGDLGRPTVQVSSGAIAIFTASSNNGLHAENFILDANSVAGTSGISVPGNRCFFGNIKVMNCANEGVVGGGGNILLSQCEVTACGGTTAAVSLTAVGNIHDCWIHDNTKSGVNVTGGSDAVVGCLITNNTGASSNGIVGLLWGTFRGNTIYGNGRDGIRLGNTAASRGCFCSNNILAKNGGYGINVLTALGGGPAATTLSHFHHNATWSNTSGAYNNMTAGVGDVNISGTDPTNDPFTAKATNDFTLNSTAGAGALLRSAGFPGTMPGLASFTGYNDIGVYRHQDPAGGGGLLVHPGMTGGLHG